MHCVPVDATGFKIKFIASVGHAHNPTNLYGSFCKDKVNVGGKRHIKNRHNLAIKYMKMRSFMEGQKVTKILCL